MPDDDTTTVPPVVEDQKEKAFDPSEHFRDIKGKEYLEVKYRLIWFREKHPHGTIETEMLSHDPDRHCIKMVYNKDTKQNDLPTDVYGCALFKARVTDGEGGVGMGHKTENAAGFDDYLEKAETGAIGRALAALGFGTQNALELDEGERIVDSPVERKSKSSPAKSPLPFVPLPAAVKAPAPTPASKPASSTSTSTPVPATVPVPSTPTPKLVVTFVPNEEQQANLAILDGAFGPYEYQAFLQQYGVNPTLPRSEWTLAIYEMLMSKLEAISEGNAAWKEQPITKEQYAEIKDKWGMTFGREAVSAFKDSLFPELAKKIFKEFTRGEADEMITKLRQAQKGKDGKLFIPETSQDQQVAA